MADGSAPMSSSAPVSPAAAGAELSTAQVFEAAAAIRKRLCTTHLDKGKNDYSSYLKEYEQYCRDREPPLAPYPITGDKAVLFIDFSMSREHYASGRKSGAAEEKRKVAGTQLGVSAIKQRINALEWLRKHSEDDWRGHAEHEATRIKLRDHATICELEAATKRDKRNRADGGQELKAIGSSSATLTKEEVIKLSVWCLKEGSVPSKIGTLMRDRSMLLSCLGTAFRGDSVRQLEWSDLFVHLATVPGRGEDQPVKLLALRADNSKVNQNGRLDEFAIARHIDPLRCAVGGLAIQALWSLQLGNQTRPSFQPDWSSAQHGKYGMRDWWGWKVYRGRASATNQEMSYKKPAPSLSRQLFPWVEEERIKLNERRAANSNAVDFALTAFLDCLEWFREVLLQDAAVLTTHGEWKRFGVFQACPVFLSAEFDAFAKDLNKAIKTHNAESARQLAQMPQRLSTGVKLALTDIKTDAERQNEAIMDKLDQVLLLLTQKNPTIDPALLAHDARNSVRPELELMSSQASSSTTSATPPTAPPAPFPSSSAAAPSNHAPPDAPSPAAALPSSAAVPSPAAPSQYLMEQQERAELMAKEAQRWGQGAVDANQPWRHDAKKRVVVPAYQFTTSPSVRGVWEEYTEGANGRWGTRMMEQTWGTGWRAAPGMKQEWSRRKKVIDLIEEIARTRASWSSELAVRFLETCYGGYSARSLADWLAKKKKDGSDTTAHDTIFQRLRTYSP
ncbi:hypothetical protein OC844_006914, partial [Tilletia horrida]